MDMPPLNFLCHPKAKETARMNSSRHRPLHTCGVSFLAIVDIVMGKTQHINGHLGSTLKRVTKLAKFAVLLIYAMQIQWLTILSFIDDAILAIEKVTEKLFPPSTRVFDKVDEVVVMMVSLPEKFEGAMNKFPTIIHEVPFLNWALTPVISRLNSLVSTLNHWGHKNSRSNEKTIGDRSYNEGYMDSLNDIENLEIFPPIISECEYKGAHDTALRSHEKGSYKDVLERGKKENPEEKMEKGCEAEKVNGGDDCECKEGREKNDGKYQVGESVKDALFELFESAWLMKAGS
ncbi:hypothetical protein PHAVU_002G175100 [Phaseolus vulgaris]|uniref:Uncharacterized protein n=2 Tax=Phaseolus vulgaris TaxID=3885 RepID=V7CN79_PHAVU|nr:hypothetical protein PHAVU_002G175100g [Phaseolus vulgaris]ESW30695.1 hypothetical protein PHAVU_002G175100g [Phaseolus vulgaris]